MKLTSFLDTFLESYHTEVSRLYFAYSKHTCTMDIEQVTIGSTYIHITLHFNGHFPGEPG